MTNFKDFLRDPIWQAIGVIVGALSLFYVISSQEQLNGKLEIIKHQSVRFEEYLLPSNLLKLNIEESIKDTDNAIVDYYVLINKGDKPIVPSDYIVPITIENSQNEKIFLVDSCSPNKNKPKKQSSTDTCEVAELNGPGWTKINGVWTATPSLINPDEQICAIVIKELLNSEKTSNSNWDGRIVGVKIDVYNSMEEYSEKVKRKFTDYLRTSVVLEEFEPYWFALLQVAAFYATLLLARQAKWRNYQENNLIWPIIIIMLLSTSTAEIIVSAFRLEALNPIVWPLLAAHIILITYLLTVAIRIRLKI